MNEEIQLLRALVFALVKHINPPKEYNENERPPIKFGTRKTYSIRGAKIVCNEEGTEVDLSNPPKGFNILKVEI